MEGVTMRTCRTDKRFLWGVAMAGLSALSGCMATAPATRTIENTFQLAAPVDTVWTAVIETFGEQVWPIDNIERVSGLITTDWILFNQPTYFDCGTPGFGNFQDQAVRFNVFVREGAGGTSMSVNTLWQATRISALGEPPALAPCVSTGEMEADFHQLVSEKLAAEDP